MATAAWAPPLCLPLLGKRKVLPSHQLAQLFKHPTAKMNAGGMPPVDLPPDDYLKALIAYVESLPSLLLPY